MIDDPIRRGSAAPVLVIPPSDAPMTEASTDQNLSQGSSGPNPPQDPPSTASPSKASPSFADFIAHHVAVSTPVKRQKVNTTSLDSLDLVMNDEGLCLATISASKSGTGIARDVWGLHGLAKKHNTAALVFQAVLHEHAAKQSKFDARLTAMESALPQHARQCAAESLAQATRAYEAAVNADQRAAMAKQAVETCDSRVGTLNDQITAFEEKIHSRLVEIVS